MRLKNPSEYSLMRIEASILTELGKVDEGVAIIQPLIGKTSQVPSVMTDDFINYLYISSLYSQGKRGKQAVETANKAYVLAQDDRTQTDRQTDTRHRPTNVGRLSCRRKHSARHFKTNPRNPIALNNLGYFLVERNEKLDEALELIKQAVKIDPTNPSYLDSLGWAYFKLGKFTEAEKNLKEAAKYDAGFGNDSRTSRRRLSKTEQKRFGKKIMAKGFESNFGRGRNQPSENKIKVKFTEPLSSISNSVFVGNKFRKLFVNSY